MGTWKNRHPCYEFKILSLVELFLWTMDTKNNNTLLKKNPVVSNSGITVVGDANFTIQLKYQQPCVYAWSVQSNKFN